MPRPGAAATRGPAHLVIPCFNEAARLDRRELDVLLSRPDLALVLVDDGSTDDTAQVLAGVCARAEGRAERVVLGANRGKAEAVRAGLLHAIERGAAIVGFADADMATPATEILRLLDEAESGRAKVVMGSRVKLLGTEIERNPLRHYVGRVFATLVSLGLDLAVYDTQCGAKFLRNTEQLRAALRAPFRSRWLVDVELIERLLSGDEGLAPYTKGDFVEVPLQCWRDVHGSKLTLAAAMRAVLDVLIVTSPLRRQARKLARRWLRAPPADLGLEAAHAQPGDPAHRPGDAPPGR